MPTLVQFDFPMQGPWGDEMAAAFGDLAAIISRAPGLRWKIWTENEADEIGGGIYLFDDSFSALDLATDARLRAALAPITSDAVQVVVGQRVSSIRGADQILVLEDGRPVGLGSHEELARTCPTYAEIIESQATAEEAA